MSGYAAPKLDTGRIGFIGLGNLGPAHLGQVSKLEGVDFLMDWRTIDCLRNGLPLDQDIYDAALWSSIGPLTEWSVAN